MIAKYGVSPGFSILSQSTTNRRQNLDNMVTAGADMVRLDCINDGTFLAALDATVDDAIARGLDPWLCLYGTTGVRSPDSFAGTAVTRYLGKATIFEICNEPDLHGWTPNQYADFLSPTYDSVIAANPKAYVIAGALFKGATGVLGNPQDPKAFTVAMCNRAAGKFHALSMHLYDWSGAHDQAWNIWAWAVEWGGTGYCDNGANGGTVRKALNDNGHSHIPILCGEAATSLVGGTLQDQADGVRDNIRQVAAGKVGCYNHFEMMEFDTGNHYSLLDSANVPKLNFTSYQNEAKKHGKVPSTF